MQQLTPFDIEVMHSAISTAASLCKVIVSSINCSYQRARLIELSIVSVRYVFYAPVRAQIAQSLSTRTDSWTLN